MGYGEAGQVDVHPGMYKGCCLLSLSYCAYIRLLLSTMKKNEHGQLTAAWKQQGAFLLFCMSEATFRVYFMTNTARQCV